MRHYLLPIESPAAFNDLLVFVQKEYQLHVEERIDGPDTVSCRLAGSEGAIMFVLGDMTGAQIFADKPSDASFAQRIALGAEERIRQVL